MTAHDWIATAGYATFLTLFLIYIAVAIWRGRGEAEYARGRSEAFDEVFGLLMVKGTNEGRSSWIDAALTVVRYERRTRND